MKLELNKEYVTESGKIAKVVYIDESLPTGVACEINGSLVVYSHGGACQGSATNGDTIVKPRPIKMYGVVNGKGVVLNGGYLFKKRESVVDFANDLTGLKYTIFEVDVDV